MITTKATQDSVMDKVPTLFLRAAVVALGVIALLFAAIILSEIYNDFESAFPSIGYLKYPVIGILSAALIPYYVALYQTMRLLSYIDTDRAFSMHSVRALRKIKHSGFSMGGLFILLLPFVYMVAEVDDAPGLIIIGTAIAGAPIAIAVFAAVLEKLLRSALALKVENDLTV